MLERLRILAGDAALMDRYGVIDAPASGAALELLAVAAGIKRLAPAGTLNRLAHAVESFLRDPHQFGVMLTVTPEDLALREAIEQYILWRRAHGAKFTTGSDILHHFLQYVDGNATCDAVSTKQVLAFLVGQGPLTRNRENKCHALAGFWRHAISRGPATRSPLPRELEKALKEVSRRA